MDNDGLLRAFKAIKQDIKERGVEAVAHEMAERNAIGSVVELREASLMSGVDISHVPDALIEGWIAGAKRAVENGWQTAAQARALLCALAVNNARNE